MKVAWVSNSPLVGSGYGVQAALFGPRIAAAGHDVAFIANWGSQGTCIDWNNHRIYPSDGEWGNRTAHACALHHFSGDDGLMIWLCDAWVLNPDRFRDDIRQAVWAPIDQWPLPQPIRRVLAHPAVTPIAMSRFGERTMEEAGLEPLYVPHAVDTQLFWPQPDIKADVREELGIPGHAFVVGMVAANQSHPTLHRKAFPEVFQAFAQFADNHPDAVLYCHTNELNSQSGLALRDVGRLCGLTRRNLMFTDVFSWELGWSRETLANAYQAFDVLLNPSYGEGFGVPIVEAQACGVPVIVNDWTSMPELCGAGWIVEGQKYLNGTQNAWFSVPNVESIVAALEEAYANRETMSGAARDFALQYDADRVMQEHWLPALDELTKPVEVGPLVAV